MQGSQGQVRPSEADALVGATINGRFRIVSSIARGGMGKVYKGEQSVLGRRCAIKVLSPEFDADQDAEFHKRFSLEASTVAKLQHPNAVTIFDYGKCDRHDVYYIAMEYIDGRTLYRVLHDERVLPEARAIHIAKQICRALHEAHRLGVVHRDLKPSNVMLVDHGDEDDFVKVLDFGLVKDISGEAEELTRAGLFMGSPKYMAPEQATCGAISARTDVYALGVLLYEMVAGKVPFDRKGTMATLVAQVNEAPPSIAAMNPDAHVSPELEAVILRCLEKAPSKRFASMRDLLEALKTMGPQATPNFSSAEPGLKRVHGGSSETYEARSRDADATPNLVSDPSSGSLRISVPPPSVSGTRPSPRASGPLDAPESAPSGAVLARGADSLSFSRARTPWHAYALAVLAMVAGGALAAIVLPHRSLPPHAVAEPAPSTVTMAATPAVLTSMQLTMGPQAAPNPAGTEPAQAPSIAVPPATPPSKPAASSAPSSQ